MIFFLYSFAGKERKEKTGLEAVQCSAVQCRLQSFANGYNNLLRVLFAKQKPR